MKRLDLLGWLLVLLCILLWLTARLSMPRLRLVTTPVETREVGWRIWLVIVVAGATAVYFWPPVFGP